MIPYYTILAFFVIGALIGGVEGFFYLGALGITIVIIFSLVLQKTIGGGIGRVTSKKQCDETAIDFMTAYPDLISKTYPNMPPTKTKDIIGTLLNDIVLRGLRIDPSASATVDPQYFFLAASLVAEEQPTVSEKEMVRKFVTFLATHRLWEMQYK
jgi:hypothetical protein